MVTTEDCKLVLRVDSWFRQTIFVAEIDEWFW
jgi:hypothetical protein